MRIGPYKNLTEIYSSERSRIYRGVKEGLGKEVIVKVIHGIDQSGLFNEVEIAKTLTDAYSLVELGLKTQIWL